MNDAVCGLCDTNCSTQCARYFDCVGLNCCLKLIRCIRINLELSIELIIQISSNGVFIWRNFKHGFCTQTLYLDQQYFHL